MGETGGSIAEIFLENEYSALPVAGRSVIDIGRNIVDSSIYFAARGAKRVIAIEPNKDNYELAKKNIELNGYYDTIELIRAARSSSDAIDTDSNEPPPITLHDLLFSYRIAPDILKMDFEGCEYDVILHAPSAVLSRLIHIQIEYHYGYRNLKDKLEKC